MRIDVLREIEPGARGVRAQLSSALREAISSGELKPGTMLMPSRCLAAELGIARNTVSAVYELLVAEGWLASRQGVGTWVVNSSTATDAAKPVRRPMPLLHDLRPGLPDVSQFPRSAWLASARRALAHAPSEAFSPGDRRGRPELREALARYLAQARGVRTSAESIVICAGVPQAVQLLGQVFGRQNLIAVESYGHVSVHEALLAMNTPTVPVRTDQRGAVVSELDDLDAAAVLLTPVHQYPMGLPLHSSRRTDVVDWAQRKGGYILENDDEGELRYERQPVSALQALCPSRVVYMGSVSTGLTPTLSVGWMVLPDDLVEPIVDGPRRYVDVISQLTLADFIARGRYSQHLRRMRSHYRKRRDEVVSAMAEFEVGASNVRAGLSQLLALPTGTEQEVVWRADESGLSLSGLASLRHAQARPQSPDAEGVVVGFGTPGDQGFRRAIDALRKVLRATGLNVKPQ